MIHIFLLILVAREGSLTDAFTNQPRHQLDSCFISKQELPYRYSPSSKPTTCSLSTSKGNNDNIISTPSITQRKRSKLGKVPILSRTIPISIHLPNITELSNNATNNNYITLESTIWEMEKPSDMIQTWWTVEKEADRATIADPFGVVMWPGSIVASQELMRRHYYTITTTADAATSTTTTNNSPIENSTVLVLGAGTGVEVQIAALLGAKKVLATDVNPFTLKLLDYGASQMLFGLEDSDDSCGSSKGPISNVVESRCE